MDIQKRIGAGLAALALVSVMSLNCLVPGVAAMPGDDCDEDSDTYAGYEQCRLLDYSGAPADLTLVARDWEDAEYLDDVGDHKLSNYIFGEDNSKIAEQLESLSSSEGFDDLSEEQKIAAYANLFDQLSYYPFGDGDSMVDLHLEDENHHEVPYSGGGVTVKYDFGFNPLEEEEVIGEILKASSYEWEPVVLHLKTDLTTELLPVSIDEDGVWTFTTTDFSVFVGAIAPIKEEEAPKTVDNVAAYVGVAVAGALSLFGAIYCSKIASKR